MHVININPPFKKRVWSAAGVIYGEYGIDAINKARRYQRIELLKATDDFEPLPFVADFHQIHHMPPHVNLSFVIKTDDPQKVGILNPFTAESRIKLLHEEFLASMCGELIQQSVINEVMSHEPTASFSAGPYTYDRTKKFTFHPKELFIDGYECSELNARVSCKLRLSSRQDCGLKDSIRFS